MAHSSFVTGLPPTAGNAPEKTPKLMSRDDIEVMIAEGKHITIFHNQVIKMDAWMPYHPGGDKAMLHLVGKDASDEIDALHSYGTRQHVLRYRIGRVEGTWENLLPPIQGGVHRTREEIDRANSEGDLNKDQDSSTPSTRVPSPVFDEDEAKGVRQRRGRGDKMKKDGARASSISSASSVDEPEMDGMSYLDTITRQHINLDLDKYPLPIKKHKPKSLPSTANFIKKFTTPGSTTVTTRPMALNSFDISHWPLARRSVYNMSGMPSALSS
ncbi:hypothetical protein NXS19_013289 [Fusarium pseudograminearum]|nr:hypothetical protein NXS19_013289 [Fusarium pseudograminearum]